MRIGSYCIRGLPVQCDPNHIHTNFTGFHALADGPEDGVIIRRVLGLVHIGEGVGVVAGGLVAVAPQEGHDLRARAGGVRGEGRGRRTGGDTVLAGPG